MQTGGGSERWAASTHLNTSQLKVSSTRAEHQSPIQPISHIFVMIFIWISRCIKIIKRIWVLTADWEDVLVRETCGGSWDKPHCPTQGHYSCAKHATEGCIGSSTSAKSSTQHLFCREAGVVQRGPMEWVVLHTCLALCPELLPWLPSAWSPNLLKWTVMHIALSAIVRNSWVREMEANVAPTVFEHCLLPALTETWVPAGSIPGPTIAPLLPFGQGVRFLWAGRFCCPRVPMWCNDKGHPSQNHVHGVSSGAPRVAVLWQPFFLFIYFCMLTFLL